MLLPIVSPAAIAASLRRFRRNRRGSAAVEFALVAPMFFALIFAIIETSLVFFAGQILETGTQDSGRLLFTSQVQASGMSATDFKTDLCNRVSVMFTCANIYVDVKSYAAGTAITISDPIDSAGNFVNNFTYAPPANGSDATVVVRAFYQWPLIVTGLGYNIANIGRGTSNSKRLLAATAAFRPQ
ncbi:MAG TPA: TadE/TadG family type IV pilus assembly protein [Tardiphaga sp.]